jgi:O-antigen/teichoic acid export membrane protein
LAAQIDVKSGLKSIVSILIGLAGAGVLAFLTQVLLGQALTVDDFGILSTAVSIAVIVTAAIGFGTSSVWLLVFGQEGWQGFRWVKQSLKFLSFWGLFVLAISWGALIWLEEDSRLSSSLWWLQAMVVMQVMVELLTAKLQIEARYMAVSLWQVLPHVGRLCVAAAVYVSAAASVDMVAKGFCAVSVILIAVSGYSLLSLSPRHMRLAGHQQMSATLPETSPATTSYLGLVRLAWPYAATALLVMVYGRIEIVFLGSITGPRAAGIYSIAVAFLLVAFLVPQAVYQKFLLPKIHRWFHSDWKTFLSVYRFGCAAMAILGIVGTLVTYWLGESLVYLFFGEKYKESGHILSILSICILFRFVSNSIGISLVTGEYRKQRVYCQAFTTLISVPSAYALISLYGIDGAIINRIVTEFTLLASYSYASSRYVLGADTWSGWSLKLNPSISRNP